MFRRKLAPDWIRGGGRLADENMRQMKQIVAPAPAGIFIRG
jgi:hypothetical protein